MKKRLFSKIALTVCLVFSYSSIHAEDEIVNFPFKISGGEIVYLPVTDSGPIPSEDEVAKIEVAGYLIGPGKGENKRAYLTWTFSVSFKQKKDLVSVRVEDVTDDKPILLVEDKLPIINNDIWKGKHKPLLINEDSLPWIYDKKTTIKVFKFTLTFKDNSTNIIYQPAWYSKQVKSKQLAYINFQL